MESVSFNKFKSCLDAWTKQSTKGEQCLAQQVVGTPSDELDSVSSELKKVLDTMMGEYINIVSQLGLEETLQNEESEQDIPHQLLLLRNCIDMYDQEFMVKECIRGIVCGDGFATQQHLTGSIALWKAESYIDQDVQQEIKNL